MKKIIALLLAMATAVSLAACSNGSPEESVTQQTGETVQQQIDGTTAAGSTEESGVMPEQTLPQQVIEETPDPTIASNMDVPASTQPGQGAILETTPGNQQSAACDHSYRLTATKNSTCVVPGTQTYTCAKCSAGYTQSLALTEHCYADATCTTPKTCTVCGKTAGSVVHKWNKYNYCELCKAKNTEQVTGPVTFTANVKSDENIALVGVTVTVYTKSSNTPAGSGVTNNKGTATFSLESHTSYEVILTNLPAGYEAKESYTFTSNTVSISLKTLPVYDPLNHSRARYRVGDTMADFTLIDTDGNTYTLSELKKTKKLIILDFWYNTCNPCKAEFPLFEEAVKQYGDQIVLLAVNPYNDMNSIRELRAELGYTFPMVTDSVRLSDGFKVTAFPTTVFIDNTGKIRKIHKDDFLQGTSATDADITSFLNTIKGYL